LQHPVALIARRRFRQGEFEALSRASSGRLVSERDLGLDDRMHRSVHRDVRQANTRPPVIVSCKGNALLLIQREPLLTVWRVKGIVMGQKAQRRKTAW
jgi:hypothetical protein